MTNFNNCCAGNYIILSPHWITITVPNLSTEQDDLAVPVEEKKKDSEGCTCRKCKEFFPYAEPNQDDGTLVCYSCRITW